MRRIMRAAERVAVWHRADMDPSKWSPNYSVSWSPDAPLDQPLPYGTTGNWYHTSPHDLPVGTTLTPRGGSSPFAEEGIYDSREFRNAPESVWLTRGLRDAHGWRKWMEEQGSGPGYVYRVQPHSRPLNEGRDRGYSVSAATILERLHPKSRTAGVHAPWQQTPEGHHVWESDRGVYRISPQTIPARTWRLDYPDENYRKANSLGDAKELAYRHYKDDPDWASPNDENFGRLEKRGL